jgi:hypothetical protein
LLVGNRSIPRSVLAKGRAEEGTSTGSDWDPSLWFPNVASEPSQQNAASPRVRQLGGRFAHFGEGQACRFNILRVEAKELV